tara:strand:+ start:2745 stop:3350 length:606 start_codon:yes stop_codon:yes gene_type:complete
MNKKEILSNIKKLLTFSKPEDFIQVEVGSYTIEVASLEVGEAISIVTEEGIIPAASELDGVHIIGTVEIIVAEGVITEVKDVPEEKVPEETEEFKEAEEEVEELEEASEETEEESVELNAELEALVVSLGEKITSIEASLAELTSKLGGYESEMTEYYTKVETLWTGLPAQKDTQDFKAQNGSTKPKKSNLEEIRAIRSKK